ncbi:hypothetical protein DPSP01_003661 [Paraphaeosphaeria sporulosa]|uniref:Exonuclease domain-containing protein n=1 Tax=Paraphaeosphaeria sporulosa TaxID=1460663 RepID=A0A177BXV2_9PLEO|nr:uncharacterized protein CC84DRAFT_408109 [Paraphaeosphaeria sporulosa]OAF99518.1 hypothetical protein CC84DRAFT_408109 [Paraphaeosphaeria sporulosa]
MNMVAQSETYMMQLQLLMEPPGDLRRHGFITAPLTDEELLLKRRCLGCNKAMSQLRGRERTGPGLSISAHAANVAGAPQISASEFNGPAEKAATAPKFKCRFHPGKVEYKYWTCCDQHCTADPCSGSDFHNPRDESLMELTRRHQLHFTPIVHQDSLTRGQDLRAAVALDCEMGTAQSGDTELIKVSLIDYFTGEVLVNNIVEPDVPLRHLNTKYSGVTWGHMREAQRRRTILKATTGARYAVWRFVGEQTIVVGHGVHNDLRSMKWIHERVVDSFVIEFNIKRIREEKERIAEEEAIAKAKADGTYVEPVKETPVSGEGANRVVVPPVHKPRKRKGGDLSLKTLVDKRLGRKIQLGEGTTGHDSLEDAIAARDLVHWHINNPGANNSDAE